MSKLVLRMIEIETEVASVHPRHLDSAGVPFCSAPAEGAYLVDEPVDVTCMACLLNIARGMERVQRS